MVYGPENLEIALAFLHLTQSFIRQCNSPRPWSQLSRGHVVVNEHLSNEGRQRQASSQCQNHWREVYTSIRRSLAEVYLASADVNSNPRSSPVMKSIKIKNELVIVMKRHRSGVEINAGLLQFSFLLGFGRFICSHHWIGGTGRVEQRNEEILNREERRQKIRRR